MKVNSIQRLIAGDIRANVDHLRIIGFALEQASAIARQISSKLQYLGIQDAPRFKNSDFFEVEQSQKMHS